MNKITNYKSDGEGGKSPMVRMEFTSPSVKTVSVAGTFNQWRPGATPMVYLGNGHWVKDLALPAGKYEYLFVADGRWLADPAAKATVPNPFGGVNSVFVVAAPRQEAGAKG